MKDVTHASMVENVAQTCTHPDIIFVVGMLGRHQNNPE